ncbi:MAG: aminotransferase class IV [Gammaproteobacteria bacterium]
MPTARLAFYAVTPSGPERLSVPAGAQTVDDVYALLALGVYTSLRTYSHHKFLDLEGHIERTRRSMHALDWEYELDERRLRSALDTACRAFEAPEMRVRIDVLAAPARPLGNEGRELIGLRAFSPPAPEQYRDGVRVRIARGLHRKDPKVKQASFVQTRKDHAGELGDAHEWLLADDRGRLLEGVSSNFYAVFGGILRTAAEGVLEGITRRIVLEQAALAGIPVELEPVLERDTALLQEAAISSSSRGLMPVVAIDDRPIGHGRPGPVVTRLARAYADYVQREARAAV